MSKARSINLKARTDILRWNTRAKSKIQLFTKEVLLEVGRRLVDYSPVGDPTTWHPPRWPKGYIPGHFKNNWQVGKDFRPTGIIAGSDYSGGASMDRLKKLGRWTVGHTYYFTNNLPYAYRLEMGWSPQAAPHGIVGRVRREYHSIARMVEAKVRNVTPDTGA